ncbi:carbohydrate sulfotransferase 11 isoform X1 [Agrilus planipennis]|uniref:Carbohydrate sulfotransferase n=1 Tax=Agrilus planipennis TaxID=224129 RepID=A0A1W4WQX9_AGRPL|nr:carbohydrate sulfotransferase 11 isoform X1 [Agrilus planipennis]XP_025830156.1 carbohydrate sulfotransferase 11 isoform X2 [Agrilus planipennis]XP_025830157.1 carbohydrate sulfotransferase 11 isoform X1 [Agrilus planipennis]
MVPKKCKRTAIAQWKFARRCIFFTTTVCIIPIILVFMVTTDQYVRAVRARKSYGKLQTEQTDYYTEVKTWDDVEKRNERRRNHLRKTCKLLGLNKVGNDSLHKPNPWEFLINKKYQLVWCNVFKAASTSWMYNFNILAGYNQKILDDVKQVPLSLARKRYPRPSAKELEEAIKNSLSFIIVRHPLERLLSAYRDKIQHSMPRTYHQKLGFQIVARYRSKADKTKLRKQRWPSFSEFVRYLLDTVKNKEPFDMHWAPITQFCTPCMFNFKFIAHTETLEEDQNYIIHQAGLEGIIKPEWRNRGKGITTEQINKYYSELTRTQILHLYNVYRYDFELFNYSLSGFIEVGKPDEDPSTLLSAINSKDPSI